jgi:hypothetical protein
MVIQCRRVEIPRCGELPDLRTPPREYVVPLSFDKPCQFTKNVDGRSPSAFVEIARRSFAPY